MKFNPANHHRQSIRLREYDYSRPGFYFVTVCTAQKTPLFGQVMDGVMQLNPVGQVVDSMWRELPMRYGVVLDEYVVMPNHFHGILVLGGAVGVRFIAPNFSKQTPLSKGAINGAPTVGKIVHDFKARCTHAINGMRGSRGTPVWQRNYWERVIRNETELAAIREYICNNPKQWELDALYIS